MKKWWVYGGFFALLLLLFYVCIFWDYDFSQSKLKVINDRVPAFNFTDQNGQIFSEKNVEGKVYVAEYFFTSCQGICPKMNANMRRVFDVYKNEPAFLIASHTCMPETDSVPVLKNYERLMLSGNLSQAASGLYKINPGTDSTAKVVNKNWFFLTGNKAELYKMAREGYIIDEQSAAGKPKTTDDFLHTQFFALIDKNRRVRGIYDGLINTEVDKLITDIQGLLKEKTKTTHFVGGFSNNPG